MENWLNITDEEIYKIDAFTEKYNMDDADAFVDVIGRYKSKRIRENSWVRKNRFRKNLKKRFLSLKPDMTQDECYPLVSTGNTIYLNSEAATDGGCYCLNHVNHLYMTRRGHVEQFTGRVEWCHDGLLYGIEGKNHEVARITNRRIRHEKIDVEEGGVLRYSTYKKKYAPKLMDVI